jgi:hypothetical protein
MNHRYEGMLRRSLEGGATMDQAIDELRLADASVIDCIKAVHTVRACDLGEAKRMVHCSPAWEELRKPHDSFHDDLEWSLEGDPTQSPERRNS